MPHTRKDTPLEQKAGHIPAIPPVLETAGQLLSNYDVLFCDVWGVVHDGFRAYPGADDALSHFRSRGGTIILVSNAPVPNFRVADMLDERRLSRDAWDGIVSSGDIALSHITEAGYKHIHAIGPYDRDAAFFDKMSAAAVALEEAEAIVCTGLNDDLVEDVQAYRERLEFAAQRNLPFVCANPDHVVDVGGTLYLCAGAIADLYQELGGPVYWAGKPYPSAYESALKKAQDLRSAPVEKSRILVIGDALRTDLKGARDFGVDALFITSGIHRGETMTGKAICPDKLAKLFEADDIPAIAAMTHLRW